MSEKFEAEVLKMFGKIDSRLDNIENTLDEHTEEFKKVNKVLDEHTEILNEHTKKLDEHTEILNEHTKKLDEHSKLIRKNAEEIEGLTEVVQSHTNTLTKFEYEFGKKIDVLYDTFQYLDREYLANKISSDNYKKKYFDHEVRISALEDLLKEKSKTVIA